MINDIEIITKSAKATEENTVVVKSGSGKVGQPTIIQAKAGVTYELRDVIKHRAPDQILLMRKGKDLWILLNADGEETDQEQPADVIIENYYGEGKVKLVGVAENGEYYTYLPQEGTTDLLSWSVADGSSSYQSLGLLHEQIAWFPFLLGAAALGGIAAAGGGSDPKPPVQHAPIATPDTAIGRFSAEGIAQPVTIDVLENDTDADNNIDPKSVKLVNPPASSTLSNDGKTLTVPGEGTWSVNPNTGAITFTPEIDFKGDPKPISYTVSDTTGLTSNPSSVTVDYPQDAPIANTDTGVGSFDSDGIAQPVTIDVLGNDTDANNNIDPTTVQIVGGSDGGKILTVPGEGTWTVDPSTGAITFTPEADFKGDPTPISYTVSDTTGQTSQPAQVIVDYPQDAPIANTDTGIGSFDNNGIAQPVTIDVLGNDTDANNNIDPTTVQIVGGSDGGKTLTVPGEGTWSVDPSTGEITFTPETDFKGDPTPISYTVSDTTGQTSQPAQVIVDYPQDAPIAHTDTGIGSFDNNGIAQPVTIDVLGNDTDANNNIDPTTVQIVGGSDGGKTLTVPGEGTWTVDPSTGAITFTQNQTSKATQRQSATPLVTLLGKHHSLHKSSSIIQMPMHLMPLMILP